VFRPDPGWYWISWDKDAVEARVNAALTDNEDLVKAFADGLDVHTITACETFGLELPKNLKDPFNTPEDFEWREKYSFASKDDLRRRLAKVQRFGTFYGPDETAILGAKGVEELDLSREDLLSMTKKYLDKQVHLQKTKEQRWDQYIRIPEARNYWGRRLRCFPTQAEKSMWVKSLMAYRAGRGPMRPGDAQKKLWNFEHQSFVAGLINRTVIAIKKRWPECRLVTNTHDALKFAFPMEVDPWPEIREIDEVTVTWPNGLSMPFTSTWHRIFSNGQVQNLR
jgi:DNA polymerase-1